VEFAGCAAAEVRWSEESEELAEQPVFFERWTDCSSGLPFLQVGVQRVGGDVAEVLLRSRGRVTQKRHGGGAGARRWWRWLGAAAWIRPPQCLGSCPRTASSVELSAIPLPVPGAPALEAADWITAASSAVVGGEANKAPPVSFGTEGTKSWFVIENRIY
jgi:hypothetical protein